MKKVGLCLQINDPEDALWRDASYMLGICCFYLEDYPGSIQTLEKLVELNPDDPEYFNILGRAYAKSGDMTKASEAVQRYQLLQQGGPVEGVEEVEEIPE